MEKSTLEAKLIARADKELEDRIDEAFRKLIRDLGISEYMPSGISSANLEENFEYEAPDRSRIADKKNYQLRLNQVIEKLKAAIISRHKKENRDSVINAFIAKVDAIQEVLQ